MKKTKISNDSLIEYGFKNISSVNPIDPYEKVLSVPSEDDDEDEGQIALVLTMERNVPEFGIRTPDGILYLYADLDQLRVIENAITGYSPNF